jgi:hypothetical protein
VAPEPLAAAAAHDRQVDELRRKLARAQTALEHAQAAHAYMARPFPATLTRAPRPFSELTPTSVSLCVCARRLRADRALLEAVAARVRVHLPPETPSPLASLPSLLQEVLTHTHGDSGHAAGALVQARERVGELESALAASQATVADVAAELDRTQQRCVALADRASVLGVQLFAARQQLVDGSEYLPVLPPPVQLTWEQMRHIPWTPYRRPAPPTTPRKPGAGLGNGKSDSDEDDEDEF